MTSQGLLFSQMDPPPGEDDQLHDWYESEHIPARMALVGFVRAGRYRALDDGPAHLAVYELADLDVLTIPEYAELKENPSPLTARMLDTVASFTRYTCRLLSNTGPAGDPTLVFAVAFAVPADELDAFEEFYEEEHVPLLMEAPGWARVRRYDVLSGEGGDWNRLALHELNSPTLSIAQSVNAHAQPPSAQRWRISLGSRPRAAGSTSASRPTTDTSAYSCVK